MVTEPISESLAEARRVRRQRKLHTIQIPEDHVMVTDELLGKGGFGAVYIADYNGRNAAAKVNQIQRSSNDQGERGAPPCMPSIPVCRTSSHQESQAGVHIKIRTSRAIILMLLCETYPFSDANSILSQDSSF